MQFKTQQIGNNLKNLLASEFSRYIFGSVISAVAFLYVFAKLADDLLENELARFDQFIINLLALIQGPKVTIFMKGVTQLGSSPIIIIVALFAMYLLLSRRREYVNGLFLLIALLGGWGFDVLLKGLFQRVRPDINRLVEVSGYSFPSGHAMVSIAFYGMIAYMFFLNSKTTFYKIIVPILLTILIFIIGISRIYLGVHYPSDVIAGFASGGLWLSGCILALHTFNHYKGKKM
jgi:undecaprenyl-diphosphatase